MPDVATDAEGPELHCEYLWPESELYVSEKHRLVYCPIQKVACTSLKLWWAELVDVSSAQFVMWDEFGLKWIDHFSLNAHYKLLHQQSSNLGRRPLTDHDWFRVVFVRNPWARLVSAFLNKFVPITNVVAKPVFEQAQLLWGGEGLPSVKDMASKLIPWSSQAREERLRGSIWPRIYGKKAWYDEFTFRHFVEYLATYNLDEDEVDLHWRPQHRFLGDIPFNFVGRFERLEEDFRTVVNQVGAHLELPAVNRTSYSHRKSKKRRWRSFADCPLKLLCRLSKMPNYREFYTRKLQDQVADLYRRDIEQFGYEFSA